MYENYTSWAEKNGFSDWALAIGWVIIAFIGFQVVAAVVFFTAMIFQNAGTAAGSPDFTSATDLLAQNFDLLFIGNSAGQILFLALATWIFCRLQVSKKERPAFLWIKTHGNTISFVGIALLIILTIQPFVWFLGWLNSFIPSPEVFDSMQLQQMKMIETYLTGDSILIIVLFHVAFVPAICEEILFRGYVLRSFEKSWGVTAAIIVSGLIFGMFHLQLTHLFPLAIIGILLGYITWVSQSIIPAMAAHFLNNAGSVLLIKFAPQSAYTDVTAETMPPLGLVVISVAVTSGIIYYLFNHRVQKDPLKTAGNV